MFLLFNGLAKSRSTRTAINSTFKAKI
uniref:Uncharacterized protein n=1 Tax=Nelumbo nucifera TaxID=4432 RepID=A0A822XJQ7_NELNU|nr:TPA_asm: hypothetical protein HUJ06_020762 [Nelumbo nucifera]